MSNATTAQLAELARRIASATAALQHKDGMSSIAANRLEAVHDYIETIDAMSGEDQRSEANGSKLAEIIAGPTPKPRRLWVGVDNDGTGEAWISPNKLKKDPGDTTWCNEQTSYLPIMMARMLGIPLPDPGHQHQIQQTANGWEICDG